MRRSLTARARPLAGLLLPLLAIAFPEPARAAPAPASDAPVPRAACVTPLPWLVPRDALEAVVLGSAAFDEPPPFHEGIDGDPERSRGTLLLDISGGLGDRVEASAQIGLQNLWGDAGTEGVVPTDLNVAFAYDLTPRGVRGAALAGRFTAKVPTAPDTDAAGTDEADVGLALSAGRRGERAGFFGSLGLELLGNPLGNGSQDDVATYGAGIWYDLPARIRLIGEMEGRAFSRFGNSPATARAGGIWLFSAAPTARTLSAHLVLFRGLNDDAARWGFTLGLSFLKF